MAIAPAIESAESHPRPNGLCVQESFAMILLAIFPIMHSARIGDGMDRSGKWVEFGHCI